MVRDEWITDSVFFANGVTYSVPDIRALKQRADFGSGSSSIQWQLRHLRWGRLYFGRNDCQPDPSDRFKQMAVGSFEFGIKVDSTGKIQVGDGGAI